MTLCLVLSLLAAPAPPVRPLTVTPGCYVLVWSGCTWQMSLARDGTGRIWRRSQEYRVNWGWDAGKRVLGVVEAHHGSPFAWQVVLDEDGCGTARTGYGLAVAVTIWRAGPLP